MKRSKHFIPKIIMYSFLILLLCIQLPSVYSTIFISEVLYNPLITESGGEAVELYNDGDEEINLSGYTLRTASSNKDATLPSSAIIKPGGFYLITDANWDEKKDDPTYPKADYEEAITMKNTDSGVALVDPNNSTIDKVGWGDENNIESFLFSNQPSNNSLNGESLQRISFTENNNIDFISAPPAFTNSLGQESSLFASTISLLVEIQDIDSFISNISVNFDIDQMIVLNPGEERDTTITFLAEEELTNINLLWQGEDFETQVTQNEHSVTIPLEHTLPPGNYSFIIQAVMGNETISKEIDFQILPLLAFSIDLQNVSCTIKQQSSCLIQGDSSLTTKNRPTLQNRGNIELDFSVFAEELNDGSNTLSTDSIFFSFSDDTPSIIIQETPQRQEVNLGIDETVAFNLLIRPPSEAISGLYKSKITIVGMEDE